MSLSAEIEKIKFAFLWKFKLDIPFLKVYKILYFALSFVWNIEKLVSSASKFGTFFEKPKTTEHTPKSFVNELSKELRGEDFFM